MIKMLRAFGLFLGLMLLTPYGNATTCITCTQGGGCITYVCSIPPAGSGFDMLVVGLYIHSSVPTAMISSLSSQVMSSEALIQRNCGEKRGQIEGERGTCLSVAANDNLREVQRCNNQNNIGWGVGGQIEYTVSFSGNVTTVGTGVALGVTRTIESPNYDKCINTVAAVNKIVELGCQNKYNDQMSAARRAYPSSCQGIFTP